MGMSASSGPNPLRAAWSVVWALRVRSPRPGGSGKVDHSSFAPVLDQLQRPGGLGAIDVDALDAYLDQLRGVDPATLSADAALAFWLNLYNAGAVHLAATTFRRGTSSVLRVPGAFDERDLVVAGEALSLNDIEHGKIRRFKDPRIHGALVCGSLSCPTLHPEPFTGASLDRQLDAQMRRFLASGGAYADREAGSIHLSRIFLWYGADFARPRRMPVFVPASRRSIASAAAAWMASDLAEWVTSTAPDVQFQGYDWGLGCSVG